jgi:lipopolysaccharide biosynthesis regulator YciM
MDFLAESYRKAGRYDDALRVAGEMWELAQKALPPQDPKVLHAKRTLGAVYRDAGRVDEAITLLKETVEQERQSDGLHGRQTLRAMQHLAVAYSRDGQLEQAATLLDEIVKARQKANGPDHPHTLEAMILLGDMEVQRANYAAAERLLVEAYRGFAKRQAAGSTPFDKEQLQAAVENLVQLYQKSQQPDKGAEWQEQLNTLNSEVRENHEDE